MWFKLLSGRFHPEALSAQISKVTTNLTYHAHVTCRLLRPKGQSILFPLSLSSNYTTVSSKPSETHGLAGITALKESSE